MLHDLGLPLRPALRALGVALSLVLAAACGTPAASTAPVYFGDAQPYPGGCAELQIVGEACDAIVENARVRLGVDLASIHAVDILTEDRCGDVRELLCTRTTAFIAGVRFTLKDGSRLWTAVFCAPSTTAIYCGPPD